MNDRLQSLILKTTEADRVTSAQVIQNLWSNYGQILRIRLAGGTVQGVVVKYVRAARAGEKEGSQSLSHRRKVKSYQVETSWYKHYSKLCGVKCRMPQLLAADSEDGDLMLILEDLNNAGFSVRKSSVSVKEIKTCLSWLADFHATFIGEKPEGLWETGTYWHLETRPDELECLDDFPLKNAAAAIDLKLKSARFQTLVHGDAKLANFCFSEDGRNVAGVDFQYVGGGIGMKDVAYFISSCLDESITDNLEKELLDHYFSELRSALTEKLKDIDADELEEEWRALYPFAWSDFYRFWKGWAAGHWGKDSYSERMKRKVISELGFDKV